MITFTKSPEQNFVRSPCQARTRQIGSISMFSIVCARMPLWGFGTFNSTGSNTSAAFQGNLSSASSWTYDPVWPAIYNTCTEQWTETYTTGPSAQTIVNSFSPYVDLAQPAQTVTGPTGTHFAGTGTITSFNVTSTVITINYTYDWFYNPANPLAYYTVTGVYTATLSGSILDPTGAGPFNPADVTYGWAALTAAANTLLADSTIPAIGTNSVWTTVDPISTPPGYQISTNYYNSSTLWEDIAAAANGFPTGPSFDQVQQMPASILDWPTPSPNTQGSGVALNKGACMSMKSTWNLNGAGWGNPSFDPGINNPPPTGLGQVMNDHACLFAQRIDLTNFNSPGSVKPAASFPNPIPWPKTVTFNPSDVTTNTGGAGTYGVLGFQAAAR